MLLTNYEADLYIHFPYNKKSDKVIMMLTHQSTNEDTIFHLDDLAYYSVYMQVSLRYVNLKDGVYTMKLYSVSSFDETIDRDPDVLMKTFEVRMNQVNDTEYPIDEQEKEYELIYEADTEYNVLIDENDNELID